MKALLVSAHVRPNSLTKTAAAAFSEAGRRQWEATVIVFPVWWRPMLAILKGWIDRVWNNGWACRG